MMCDWLLGNQDKLIAPLASLEVLIGDAAYLPGTIPHPWVNPGQALLVLGRVGQFMRQRGGVAFGVAEGLEGRHLHVIRTLGVKGAGAAVPDIDTGRGEEPVGAFDARSRRQGGRLGLGGVLGG